MSKKRLMSVTESVVLAARMTKALAGELIYLRKRNTAYDSECDSELNWRDIKKIDGICAQLDIRQLDVISASEPKSGKRRIVIKIVFGRNREKVEDYIATGTCVLEKGDGWRWDPLKRAAYEGPCWGPDSGQVSLQFPSGETETGLETKFDVSQTDLPPL